MHRGAAQLRRDAGRHVVDLTVAQQHDGGQPLRRHFDEGLAHGFDQACAARPFAAELDVRGRQHGLADLEAFLLAEFALQRFPRHLDLLVPFADRHGVAVVDHDQRHVGDRLALLLDQRRIAECRQHHQQRTQPPPRAARLRPQAEQHQHEADAAQHREHPPRQQRIESDGNG